jgi:AraC-like DNA-binding protein
MESRILFGPPVVEEVEAATWAHDSRPRTCIELLSIRRGSGVGVVNNSPLPYHTGSLFLLNPTDTYCFVSEQPTRFGVLRFEPGYLARLTALSQPAAARQHMHEVATLPAHGTACSLELAPAEHLQLEPLFTLLFAEHAFQHGNNKAFTESLLQAVLSVIGHRIMRSGLMARPTPSYAAAFIQRLLAYIRQHIAEPNRLRIEQLAEEFAYSPKHLSALFKQETGESLHRYIVRYKLQLVEVRLLQSTHTVSQIADELAFTDVCHLNKQFKKLYHATPSNYRRHLAGLAPTRV